MVIAALIDPPGDARILSIAVALAEEHGARLTIAAVCRGVPLTAALAPLMCPWTIEQLRADAFAESAARARDALRQVPMNLGADHRVLTGRPARALKPLLVAERVHVVVLPARCRQDRRLRRAARSWLAAGIDVRFGPTVAED